MFSLDNEHKPEHLRFLTAWSPLPLERNRLTLETKNNEHEKRGAAASRRKRELKTYPRRLAGGRTPAIPCRTRGKSGTKEITVEAQDRPVANDRDNYGGGGGNCDKGCGGA